MKAAWHPLGMAAKKRKPVVRRWVIKAGSRMVCDGGPVLVRAWMSQVAQLKKQHGIEVIWVTSGAIALAMDRTDFNRPRKLLPEKQALSALGQPMVMDLYNLALNATGQLGAQVLLTAGDIKDATRRGNLQNTLHQLLEWKAVPILNENDAVATEEIQFGDNDSLSSKIAVMMKAERLVLLTDVDGFFESDPKTTPNAKPITFLNSVTNQHLRLAGKKGGSSVGTGGMYSKLMAAGYAAKHGIVANLVRGDHPQNLLALAEGKSLGTQVGGQRAS
jgi:glutamate 5-kinase